MTDEHQKSCPRCRVELEPAHLSEPLAGFDYLRCPSCKGRLMKSAQLKMVEETVEPRLFELRRLPSAEQQAETLPCPACDSEAPMEKFEHSRDHRVIVDRCRVCRSVWLDAGELRAIQEEALPVFLANTVRYFWQLLK